MSNSLRPHGLQHARLPCPSPIPGACSNSCLSSWWYHPTISSTIILFSSCLQSFPASGSLPMSQFLTSGGQSIGASASVLPINIQDWSPWGWTSWISLQSKGLSRSSPISQFKSINSLVLSFLYSPTLTSYMTTGKTIALTRRTFVGKSYGKQAKKKKKQFWQRVRIGFSLQQIQEVRFFPWFTGLRVDGWASILRSCVCGERVSHSCSFAWSFPLLLTLVKPQLEFPSVPKKPVCDPYLQWCCHSFPNLLVWVI